MDDDRGGIVSYPNRTFKLGVTCTELLHNLRACGEDGRTKVRPGMGLRKEMSSMGWIGTALTLLGLEPWRH